MKKPFLVLAALATALALGLGVWAMVTSGNEAVNRTPVPTTQEPVDPADQTEDREPVSLPDDEANPDESDTSPTKPTPTDKITVTITGSDDDGTVTALLRGATSGTCTAVYTRSGGSKVTATGNIVRGGTYISCETSPSALTKGTWNVTLTAKSSTGEGSATTTVTVK